MCVGEQSGAQSHSALRIVAACQSTAEFVAAYSRYCEGRSLFIATKSPKATGQIVKFKVALASGEHLITGVGPVVETFTDRDNRFNRPGMRVEVEKLDASGRHWMEQLRRGGGASAGTEAPAVASSPTGMFSTVHDESMPVAAAKPPAAPAPVEPAPAKRSAVPVPVADNLSSGWELDGLPLPLPLPKVRPATDGKASEPPADRPRETAEEKAPPEKPPEAVVASGELDVPPPLPPPPRTGTGRSKRITFPALMFNNKSRGLATPPTGAVVPKPIAGAAAAGGKLRPPTAPLTPVAAMSAPAPLATATAAAAPAPVVPAEREPAAPMAPLGTPADTEPHSMVPREIESSLARAHPPAEGTPPPAAEPEAPAAAEALPADEETHPEITDAPPETSEPTDVQATEPLGTPDKVRKRTKASTTTPPPVWNERTVTQTLQALVGGKPDPRVQEETIHWTNPGFAALTRPTPPQVAIVETPAAESRSGAVPVVVGVEISSDVMDRTVISPPPDLVSRRRLIAAVAVTAVAGIAVGYILGLRQAPVDKMPVGEAAASPAVDRPLFGAQCAEPAPAGTATAAAPAGGDGASSVVSAAEPTAAAAAASVSSRKRGQEPPAAPASSPSGCYLNAMTSPVGATVLIDNKVSGRTPLRSKIPCGRHSVKFEMASYQATTRTINVRRGETEKVSAELARPRAVLRIESSPGGATVQVNGTSVGVTPLTTTVAGFASSTVTLSRQGYKTISRTVSPTSTSARLSVTLKADAPARRSASSRR